MRCSPICVLPLLATAFPAAAEIHRVPDCAGQSGIGIATYVRTEGRDLSVETRLTELCWTEADATLTAVETSRDLEMTGGSPGMVVYQRLDGGTVSPLNEQLQLGDGRPATGPGVRYIDWKTGSSRARDELGGFDDVSIEGYVAPDGALAPGGGAGHYDVEMLLTGEDGPAMSMIFNVVLPMEGKIAVDGEALTLGMTSVFPGMGPGEVTLEARVTRGEAGFAGEGDLAMTNGLKAGAPPGLWKTVDVDLAEFAARFAGTDDAEVVFAASFTGAAETFGGDSFPATFTLVGRGRRAD